MLMGRQIERPGPEFAPDCRQLWLIHPSVTPPSELYNNEPPPAIVTVVLPEIDEAGNGAAWRRWAKAVGGHVLESPATGLDIRASWPIAAQENPALSRRQASEGFNH